MNATYTPPILTLAKGHKPRLHHAVVIRPKEIELHITVARLLRDHCLYDWQHFHVPSGEIRDKRTAAKLKAMGVKRGIPDFILDPPTGPAHYLELKRIGEKLNREQESFRLWCVKHEKPHVVAHTLEEVLTAFDNWGCTRLKIPQRRIDDNGA